MGEKSLIPDELPSQDEVTEEAMKVGQRVRMMMVRRLLDRRDRRIVQLESQIDAMRDFMALLYLGIREGRDEAFEKLDEKTKNLINEVWFERLEEDAEDEDE